MRRFTSIAASALAAGPAFAHAKLVSAAPAADAKASNVRTLSLNFSETLIEKMSGVEIVMTGMPGMTNHAPMKVSGFKTALTADTHRIEGSYSFSVK